jgi:molecular chaperone GrpE (heat shock protein)
MAKIILDEDGCLDKPCLVCENSYIDIEDDEWCCDEKECPYKSESEEMAVINNRLKDLSERVENIEKQIKEEKEEQLRRLQAQIDFAELRCSL